MIFGEIFYIGYRQGKKRCYIKVNAKQIIEKNKR